MVLKTREFRCHDADQESLRWLEANQNNFENFKIKTFICHDSGSHRIDISYKLQKGKKLIKL